MIKSKTALFCFTIIFQTAVMCNANVGEALVTGNREIPNSDFKVTDLEEISQENLPANTVEEGEEVEPEESMLEGNETQDGEDNQSGNPHDIKENALKGVHKPAVGANDQKVKIISKYREEVKEVKPTDKDGKKTSVLDRIKAIEANMKPTNLTELIPLLTKNTKCDASGKITTLYHPDSKHPKQPALSRDEQKLTDSLKKYMEQVKKNKNVVKNIKTTIKKKVIFNKETEQLVNGKWAVIVFQFFARAVHNLQKSKKIRLSPEVYKSFEKLTMEIIEKNLFLQEHNKVNYANLPEVDLHEFSNLEPQPYHEKIPKECQQKQAELKKLAATKQNMCSIAKLMAVALSDILVGKDNIIICFLDRTQKSGWLVDTIDKLEHVYNQQVISERRLNGWHLQDVNLPDHITLLNLINYDWASLYLRELDEKYTEMKHDLPVKGEQHAALESLHKETVALRKSVEDYHKSLESHSTPKVRKEMSKKKAGAKVIKLDEFFTKGH